MGDFLFGLLNSFIYLYNMEAKLIKVENTFYLKEGETILGTSSNPNLSASIRYLLSLKNCQAIELGYDLDELKTQYIQEQLSKFDKESYERYFPFAEDEANILIDGFQKAIEFLGDKKFSEDDVNLAFVLGKNKDESRINKLINSKLQQTEWDCIVEMEKVKDKTKIIGSVKGVKGSGHKITTYKSVPVFDADGCLILKRK